MLDKGKTVVRSVAELRPLTQFLEVPGSVFPVVLAGLERGGGEEEENLTCLLPSLMNAITYLPPSTTPV